MEYCPFTVDMFDNTSLQIGLDLDPAGPPTEKYAGDECRHGWFRQSCPRCATETATPIDGARSAAAGGEVPVGQNRDDNPSAGF